MTQRDRVLRQLRHGPVNTSDFLTPTCDGGKPILRIAARIFDLQADGFGIRSERKLNGTATYFLVRDVERGSDQPPSKHGGPNPTHAQVAVPLAAASLFDDSDWAA